MTEQEWKRRCVARIYRAVKGAGHIRIRALKRATNYGRWPEGDGSRIWFEALEHLERSKRVVIERNYEGVEVSVSLASAETELKPLHSCT